MENKVRRQEPGGNDRRDVDDKHLRLECRSKRNADVAVQRSAAFGRRRGNAADFEGHEVCATRSRPALTP